MFDTILLLAAAAEQSILPLALRGHNPLLTVIPVGSAAELAALDSGLLTEKGMKHIIACAEAARAKGLSFRVMRDNAWNMVAFQQKLKFGRTSGTQLGDYDIASYAESFGARGYRVSAQEEFLAALDKGLSEEGVSIIDVPVDYSHSTDIGAQLHEGVFE